MSNTTKRYFIVYKPFNMVSQFVSPHKVGLLGDLDFDFPEGTHAVGRLDNHSEGLLILTTDKTVTRRLFLSTEPHQRTYLVQINNRLSTDNLERLRNGVAFKIKNGEWYTTSHCAVELVSTPEQYCMIAPVKIIHPPYTWLLIALTEGKYHQVRKMIGAIHHKVKRLIRVSIEDLQLGNMEPGQVKEMHATDFFRLLHIPYSG
ncbi:MAG: rRNA pseudouridine synthase [Bacteroidetes bacterium]|nr:rRNA pseudouridine synthase [Bacteroidota bacterium]